MVLDDHKLGLIDYQDMLSGPVTYDLVSLLKDCYHVLSREKQEAWVRKFFTEIQVLL